MDQPVVYQYITREMGSTAILQHEPDDEIMLAFHVDVGLLFV
jgi:hypothetical protein